MVRSSLPVESTPEAASGQVASSASPLRLRAGTRPAPTAPILSVWKSFFRDLPPDLEEAALVDGTTRLGALWRIVLPLTAPGVFTTAILSFITVWNDFLFGLTLTEDSNAQTVTVAIPLFNGEHQIAFGEVSAAAIIVTIPLVIMVLFLQRRIVSGLTAGAVKG
jgi:multiple sugar transport system permease protein